MPTTIKDVILSYEEFQTLKTKTPSEFFGGLMRRVGITFGVSEKGGFTSAVTVRDLEEVILPNEKGQLLTQLTASQDVTTVPFVQTAFDITDAYVRAAGKACPPYTNTPDRNERCLKRGVDIYRLRYQPAPATAG